MCERCRRPTLAWPGCGSSGASPGGTPGEEWRRLGGKGGGERAKGGGKSEGGGGPKEAVSRVCRRWRRASAVMSWSSLSSAALGFGGVSLGGGAGARGKRGWVSGEDVERLLEFITPTSCDRDLGY